MGRSTLFLALLLADLSMAQGPRSLPASATLGGVTLGEPFQPVNDRLGKPLRVIYDDGAAFGTDYIWDGIRLSAGFNSERVVTVQQIEVTSPRYCTPSGVCPGMEQPDAQRILGKPVMTDVLVEGRNDFLIDVEACWLEVVIAGKRVQSLAIKCQP